MKRREGDSKRYTQRKKAMQPGEENYSDVAASQRTASIAKSHQRLGRGKEFLPRALRGSMALLILWFGVSGFLREQDNKLLLL